MRGRRLGRAPRCGDPSAGARRPHDRPPFVRRVRGHRAPRAPPRARRRVGGRNGRGHQSVRADDDPARIRPRLLRGDRRDATAAVDPTVQAVTLDNFRLYFGPVVPSETIDRHWAPAHDSRVRGAAPACAWRTRGRPDDSRLQRRPSTPGGSATLRARMGRPSLDVLLVVVPENLFYLTGYETIGYASFALLAGPARRRAAPLRPGDGADGGGDDHLAPGFETFTDTEDPVERAVDLAAEARLARRPGRRRAGRFVRLAGHDGPPAPAPRRDGRRDRPRRARARGSSRPRSWRGSAGRAA